MKTKAKSSSGYIGLAIRPNFKEFQKICIERFMITHKMKNPKK